MTLRADGKRPRHVILPQHSILYRQLLNVLQIMVWFLRLMFRELDRFFKRSCGIETIIFDLRCCSIIEMRNIRPVLQFQHRDLIHQLLYYGAREGQHSTTMNLQPSRGVL